MTTLRTKTTSKPVMPRHVTTGTCAVRGVLAYLLPSIKRTVGK